MVLNWWLQALSKVAALVVLLPMAVLFLAYTIYCHGRFGQTIGKRVMNIRVVRTNGQRIGWWEAWLRSSFDVLFATLGILASFVALTAVSDADYYGVGFLQRTQNLHALQPWWLGWTEIASEVWVWSEVVVMLFNRQRRALHDFIAGTVVTAEGNDSTCTDPHRLTRPLEPTARLSDDRFHFYQRLSAIAL
jgi:uncharacterized RDD family membrane protein YckC